MRSRLALPAVVLVTLAVAAPAPAQTGGASAPGASGGTQYGQPVGSSPKRDRSRSGRRARPLVASVFSVSPATLQPGAVTRLAYRVDGRARRVRVRIEFVAEGAASAALRMRLGWKLTGRRYVRSWKLPPGVLREGSYVARLHAVDDHGNRLIRNAAASGRSPVTVAGAAPVVVGNGVFPVRGPFSYGGDDARFGADRGTHSHQGQDIMAAHGTPVVTPRSGRVRWKAYQAGGAGHYVVIRGDDDRDYVFMHLVSGSIPVRKEDTVTAGQQIGEVGNTGRSKGAHLHFEIWPCGWYVKGCDPIDPRPDLDAWAAASGATLA